MSVIGCSGRDSALHLVYCLGRGLAGGRGEVAGHQRFECATTRARFLCRAFDGENYMRARKPSNNGKSIYRNVIVHKGDNPQRACVRVFWACCFPRRHRKNPCAAVPAAVFMNMEEAETS